MLTIYLLILSFYTSTTLSANILCFFWVPSISHQLVFQAIWKELSLRGHNVTVIAPNPLNDPSLTNLTEINTNHTYTIMTNFHAKFSPNRNVLGVYTDFYEFIDSIITATLETPDVQELITKKKSGNFGFDVVLSECWHPIGHALAAHFEAPSVYVSSLAVVGDPLYEAIGNPSHTSLYPDFLFTYQVDLGLLERVASFYFKLWHLVYYHWVVLPRGDLLKKRFFGDGLPYLGALERNVSLVLVSSNFVFGSIRANVPAIVEIGNVHVRERRPLQEDLENIISKSKRGVLYFSLGTNTNVSVLPMEHLTIIRQALSELPYTVLWKREDADEIEVPENIIARKWFPQQDILGHPNVKAFICQGGMQSTSEAINRRVPLVLVPLFADQFAITKGLVSAGVALQIDMSTMTKSSLKNVIIEVAENQEFKSNMEQMATLLEDQPMCGLEKAVWWIEYVIRHKGAKHLQSPLVALPIYQIYYLDVIGSSLLITFVGISVLKYIVCIIVLKCREKEKIA